MASSWLLAGLLLLSSAAEIIVFGRSAGCQARCGDVDIPYPFGIGGGCFRSEGFEIACNTSNGDDGDLVPTLAAANDTIRVQRLLVDPRPEVKVMLPVAYQCYNSAGNVTRDFYGDVELNKNGVYRISDERNVFVVLGCNTVAWTQNGDSGGRGIYSSLYYTGCVTYCSDSGSAMDGKCAGIGCCHVDIPPELTDNVVTFQQWPRDLRLDIAVESAEGLRYMHSSISHTIRHGDIKPANILLTDKFIAKISDFGTSKLLTADKEFTMVVAGSMGYIDPVFYMTGHLTQKSDVYSFGVVLLELISRKPTIYDKNYSLIIEFQKAYDRANSGRALFDKDIAIEEDVLILEEIGRLAMDCLNEKIEEQPDMKEVAARLMMLRRSRNDRQKNYNASPQQYFEEISIEENCKNFGADIRTNSSRTLLLHSV
uniref:Protein kinase domain-containing protein n=1 Tax=Oryza rufipogon TaxID=4529 RepID=A0A0E0QVL4_ORYRU